MPHCAVALQTLIRHRPELVVHFQGQDHERASDRQHAPPAAQYIGSLDNVRLFAKHRSIAGKFLGLVVSYFTSHRMPMGL
jgi:hypothetical protein